MNARTRTAGRLATVTLAATAAFGVMAAAASAAPVATPTSGDDRATAVAGNLHDGKTGSACAQLGFPNDTEVAVGSSNGYSGHDDGFTVTSDGQNLTVSAIPDGLQVHALVVKGGDAYNIYPAAAFSSLPATGLHSPLVGKQQDNVPTISHWFLCAGDPGETPPTVAPTASIDPGCSTVAVTLDAGTSAAALRIDPAGSGTAHDVAVPANSEATENVPLSAASPTVTVLDTSTDPDSTLATYTRPASCDGSTGQTTIDPKVSFATSCTHGITAVLSNMAINDTTTEPVTFTITTPAGKTESVTVGANHIVKRYYGVAEGKTGVVTVAAPGMSTTSKSYAKKCTKVLGEKVTRKPVKSTTKVLGERVSRLPMTGIAPGAALTLAAALLVAGTMLNRAGRRTRSTRA